MTDQATTAGSGRVSAREAAVAEGRLDPGVGDLRVHTARGTLINTGFQVGLAGLGLIKRVGVAAFLTREEFGVWGILLATLITLAWLKQVGIMDKYVQQAERDAEAAFQKAFTLELGLSTVYFLLCCAVLPLYALAYGHAEIILPGVLLATSVIVSALQTPAWIPYRRMEYARQRLLTSVDPVVSVVVTLGLGASGFGYWALVLGALAGSVAGAAVCVAYCPYRLRLRFDRQTVREYASFSWPLVGLGMSRLLVVQGSLLAANRSVGLAGVGAIGLATSFAAFSDRVQQIVSQTIYPAVCAVADRIDRMAEVFVKSNRLALMWAMPFATGLALFAGDLVHFVLGDRWEPAIGLFAAIGLTCGFGQIAFNWGVFMRATNRTRPLFLAALLDVAVFVAVMLPATLALGLTGYALGFATATAVQVGARAYFMHRLLGGFNVVGHMLRAIAPAVPAALIVLAARAIQPDERSLSWACGEFAVFVLASVGFTYAFERKLVSEVVGYVRGRVSRPAPSPSPAAGT